MLENLFGKHVFSCGYVEGSKEGIIIDTHENRSNEKFIYIVWLGDVFKRSNGTVRYRVSEVTEEKIVVTLLVGLDYLYLSKQVAIKQNEKKLKELAQSFKTLTDASITYTSPNPYTVSFSPITFNNSSNLYDYWLNRNSRGGNQR